ncbi:3-hydroxyacyl-CoA dehydrogenase family protein [Peribacillus cavernae]|nr:3-hydroxyacyl-CoA dehydrogenase family protein [Peribacillus cavernae]MDQ0219446.1 3-hydroxybutyryl-CoA dehydrogenase [Peribacillus cavernae]
MQIQQIGIVGSGHLGTILSQKFQGSGIPAIYVEANEPSPAKMSVLQDCQFIIEVVPEQLSEKIKVLKHIEEIVPSEMPIAITISSLSLAEIASSIRNPERVVGLHFFTQANRDKLVEVIRSLQCSDTPYLQVYELMKKIGQVPVRTKDVPGFLINRLFVPYMNHAIQSYEDELTTKEDLDTAIELGLGYPMGPLKLADVIGLDDYLFTANTLFQELYDTKYAPPSLVNRMVDAGYQGKKTQKGFYEYSSLEEVKE